jgi:NitT/TauT family transport system substrate-binding protein
MADVAIARSRALALLGSAAVFPAAARAQSLTTVKIGSVAADSYAEPFYGADMDFFKRAGIDAQVQPFASSGAAAAACAGGAVDVALTDIAVIANAVGRGVPFTAFAGSGLYAPGSITTALCALKSSPYQQAKDFEGQTIAVVTLVSVSSVAVKAWLTKNGADLSKVRIVEMPFPEMGAALVRGTVQAAFVAEPSLSQLPPEVHVIADPYGAIAKAFLISVWFTSRDWLAKNETAAKGVVRAIYDTARWANHNRDKTAEILAKYSKLPLERVQHMRRAEFATSLTTPLLQPILDAGYEYKAIQHQVDAATLMTRV